MLYSLPASPFTILAFTIHTARFKTPIFMTRERLFARRSFIESIYIYLHTGTLTLLPITFFISAMRTPPGAFRMLKIGQRRLSPCLLGQGPRWYDGNITPGVSGFCAALRDAWCLWSVLYLFTLKKAAQTSIAYVVWLLSRLYAEKYECVPYRIDVKFIWYSILIFYRYTLFRWFADNTCLNA